MPESMGKHIITTLGGRKAIESTFRNVAVTLGGKGNADGANLFRKMIESDAVDSILDQAAVVFEQNFTQDELREILAFKNSPVGKKFDQKARDINGELTKIAQKAILREIAKEIEQRGDKGCNSGT